MTGVIDLGALATVAAIAFVGGVGVVSVFSLGLVIALPTDGRPHGAPAVARGVLAVMCMALCVGIILLGVWTMLDR